MRSYLSKHQPQSPTPPEQIQRMAAAAWHKQGVAFIPVDEITDHWAKQMVTNIANKRYGKREKSA